MSINKSHLKNIKQANEENRLAIFVGAGVSKSSDTDYIKMPLWSDLISELKSDLSIDEDVDYLKIAQLYHLEFGPQKYHQTLKKYFPEDIPPSSLHKEILNLKPRIIITTNWDSIIENTIEQEGHLYDTIRNDNDLVSSTSQNKFIKIHGDFIGHNIVFKEDDYIDYSRNFPLIENYIKSIFSTHTVLFLGYSYNDINLKHIMKWIQSHSTSAPPMFLVNYKQNKAQENYLKNHGITTLILNKDIYSIDDNGDLDDKSAIMKSFINTIMKDDLTVDYENEQEIINFIFERIKHLKHQELTSHNQIRDAISNCGFVYDSDGFAVLDLFKRDGYLTIDCSDRLRLIHEKFLAIISKLDNITQDKKSEYYKKNKNLEDIFEILASAQIKGIILPNQDKGSRSYFINEKIKSKESMDEHDLESLSFSNCKITSNDLIKKLSSESYENYRNGDYELAFKNNSQLIKACKRNKIYSVLLIALFNRNSILFSLKYSFSQTKSEFEKEEDVSLQDEFFSFPKSEIKKNQILYDFLSLKSVYKHANECTKKIVDLNHSVETIKNGGFSFNSNADEPTSTHINLLMFAVKNHILIDEHSSYQAMMRDFVKISFIRQSVKKSVTLNKYEIYSAIKFFTPKDLKRELSIFFNNKESVNCHLGVNQDCLTWITSNIMPNLTNRIIAGERTLDNKGNEFENCVRLLSHIDLDDDNLEKVFNEFSKLIISDSTTIGIYRAINEFLSCQHVLFRRNIKNSILIELLNNIFDKVIKKRLHAWDHHAITNGSIRNLYGYIEVNNEKYSDSKRVSQIISMLKDLAPSEQCNYSKSLLYSIYCISDASIQKIIKQFVHSFIRKSKSENFFNLNFNFWAVAVDFKKFDLDLIEDLDKYLNEFRDRQKFSSNLFELRDTIKHLVEVKKIKELVEINNELLGIINDYESKSQNIQFEL